MIKVMDGTLVRRSDGWYWSDGQPAPQVQDVFRGTMPPGGEVIWRGDTAYVRAPGLPEVELDEYQRTTGVIAGATWAPEDDAEIQQRAHALGYRG